MSHIVYTRRHIRARARARTHARDYIYVEKNIIIRNSNFFLDKVSEFLLEP